MTSNSPSFRSWRVLIVVLCSLIYLIRITGPNDLESYAQVLNVGYILDLMTQGHWLVQYDLESAIMSKPPLHTLLMAPFTALFGLNRLALTLPSFLSVLALGLLVLEVGRRRFGELAGGLATLAIVLAPIMAKQITLVRTDPLFTLTVAVAALAAFFAWERGKNGGKGWLLFWFMAAMATLTKGPLGIVLACGGLLSYFWERRSNSGLPSPRGPHLAGITLYLMLTLGWFVAAWISEGQALIDKMLYSELVYHAVGEHRGGWQATDLLKPSFFLLVRFLPFSLPFCFALWRVCRHPATDPGERRFERFLTCWILSGLLIFSLVKHQRADHLLPLWPACALLAGREMARYAETVGKKRYIVASMAICAMLIGSIHYLAHTAHQLEKGTSDYSQELGLARDAEQAAAAFTASGLDATKLVHYSTPITLQLHLGTYRPFVSKPDLDSMLAKATTPVDIALGTNSRLETITIDELDIAKRYPNTRQLFRWPADESEAAIFQVVRVTP